MGADPATIARGLFKSRPASSLGMQGRILQGLHYEFGDRLVWGSISQSGLRDSGATTDQADSAIDQLNTIRGQDLPILFKEAGPPLTNSNIRTPTHANPPTPPSTSRRRASALPARTH